MFWRRRKAREQDLERELRTHLELEFEEQEESGLEYDAARHAARRAFGNPTLVKENVREMWGWGSLERVWYDIRYAFRGFRNHPQFTCVALLTLALGIGANTGLFSVLNAVLLRTLPVQRPEELLRALSLDKRGEDMGFSWPLFEALQHDQKVFSGLYAATDANVLDFGTTGEEKAVVQLVSGDYFGVLGVATSLGRPITREDNARGAQAVAVISDGFWKRRFGRNAGVLGEPIIVNHQLLTVVGVAPPEFFGDIVGNAPDIWTPVILQDKLNPGQDVLDEAGVTFLHAVGRLRNRAEESQVQAGLTVSLRQIQSETDSRNRGPFLDVNRFVTEPASRGLSELRDQFSKPLRFLMGLVVLLLLLACANVANLLLARTAARQKDIAVRLATGASLGRVVRQTLTESLLLACLGGLAGLWTGYALSHLLVSMLAGSADQMVLRVDLDLRVLVFTFAGSLITGLIFGIGPVLAAIRVDPIQSFKGSASQQNQGFRSGKALVAIQVALSLLLVTAAGLFVRTLHNLRAFDAGFARDGVLQVIVDASAAGYKSNQLVPFYNRVIERLNRLPGVRASSFASLDLIGGGGGHICCVALPGKVMNGSDDERVLFNTVMPGYFKAVGMTLLKGRTFSDHDVLPTFESIVLNESLATKLFGKKDPIGSYLELGWGTKINRLQVIGVIKDARYSHLREPAQGIAYFPITTSGDNMRALYVRTDGDVRSLVPAVLKGLKGIDSSVPIKRVNTMGEIIGRDVFQERLIAELSSGFGVLALTLAAVGLYGLLAYSVTRRTGEIGVRTALGAQRRDVIGIVIRDAAWLVGIGLAIGFPAAWAGAHLASSMLFGFSADNPLTFVISIGVLAGACMLASWIPAWRASRIDPMVALRYE